MAHQTLLLIAELILWRSVKPVICHGRDYAYIAPRIVKTPAATSCIVRSPADLYAEIAVLKDGSVQQFLRQCYLAATKRMTFGLVTCILINNRE